MRKSSIAVAGATVLTVLGAANPAFACGHQPPPKHHTPPPTVSYSITTTGATCNADGSTADGSITFLGNVVYKLQDARGYWGNVSGSGSFATLPEKAGTYNVQVTAPNGYVLPDGQTVDYRQVTIDAPASVCCPTPPPPPTCGCGDPTPPAPKVHYRRHRTYNGFQVTRVHKCHELIVRRYHKWTTVEQKRTGSGAWHTIKGSAVHGRTLVKRTVSHTRTCNCP